MPPFVEFEQTRLKDMGLKREKLNFGKKLKIGVTPKRLELDAISKSLEILK